MKLGVPFLQLPIRFDAAAMAAEIEAIGEHAWRPHPQGYPGNDALPLISRDGDPGNDDVSGPMRPTPHLERCPYLMQVLDGIGATWGRSRLMRLSGRAEVTSHVDVNYYWRERARVHVPIVTQPTVRFVCGSAQVNMRAGECWIFDTWREHNVFNDDNLARVHLVADTVGGDGFWQHVANGRPHDREIPGWQPRLCAPVAGLVPPLDYETRNVPPVMTPWEIRAHYAFLLQEALPHPDLTRVQLALLDFSRRWQSLWACYGESPDGWPRYREVLDAFGREMTNLRTQQMFLTNGISIGDAVSSWIIESSLADRRLEADPEIRRRTAQQVAAPAAPTDDARVFDRPVFIVSPPRSGSTMLFETLSTARAVFTIGDESHQLIEGLSPLALGARDFDSNRLLAADATAGVSRELRARFYAALRDREQRRPAASTPVRMLEKTPKNALRIPFLAEVFPQARFVYLHRDPRQVLSSMIEAWTSGRFVTYPLLPGWTGPPWSLLLVPGWRALRGQPLPRIVATQWSTTTQLLLDDLEQLPRERWSVTTYEGFLADPQGEAQRICAAHGLEWDRKIEGDVPLANYTVSLPDPQKWKRHEAEVAAVWPSIEHVAVRAEALQTGRSP